MADLKNKATIEIVDKATAKLKKINAAVKGLARSLGQAGSGNKMRRIAAGLNAVGLASGKVRLTARSLRTLGMSAASTIRRVGLLKASLMGLGRAARGVGRMAFSGLVWAARRAATGIKASLIVALRGIGRAARAGAAAGRRAIMGLSRVMKTGVMAAGAVGVAGAFGAFKFGKNVVAYGRQIERLRVQLLALEGSKEKAAAAFNWVLDFAQRTPLQVEQVIAAYAKLKAFGIDPANGSMKAMVDMMAKLGGGADVLDTIILATGKAFSKGKVQAEEALMMLERGVPVWKLLAKAMGKTEQQVQQMASQGKIGRREIGMFLKEMGRYADGSSLAMSKTLDGIISNINDAWGRVKIAINDAGLFDWVKGKAQAVLNWITRLKQEGKLDAWAKRISDGLIVIGEAVTGLVEKLASMDFKPVFDGAGKIVTSLKDAFSGITVDDVKAAFEGVATTIKESILLLRDLARAIKEIKDLFSGKFTIGKWNVDLGKMFGGGNAAQGRAAKGAGMLGGDLAASLGKKTHDFFASFFSSAPKAAEQIKASADAVGQKHAEGAQKVGQAINDGSVNLRGSLEDGMNQAAARLSESGAGVGERISAAMQARAAAIGSAIGQAAAGQIGRAVSVMQVRMAPAPAGAARTTGRSHAKTAPRGFDRPAPAKTAIADGA